MEAAEWSWKCQLIASGWLGIASLAAIKLLVLRESSSSGRCGVASAQQPFG